MSSLYFSFLFFIIVFISWCSLFISRFTVILFSDGINQIFVGIKSNPMAVLVQFKPLKTNRRPLYLETQSVPRCKHFSSRL
jgi:hypothetical protein